MRVIQLVRQIVDAEVHVHFVVAQRFPVERNIGHAIACFASGRSGHDTAVDNEIVIRRFHAFHLAVLDADFEIGVLKAVGERCRPCTADGRCVFGIGAQVVAVKTGFRMRHAQACGETALTVAHRQFVASVFNAAGVDDFLIAVGGRTSARADVVVAAVARAQRVADVLPEIAAFHVKSVALEVEADFGIARAFGFGVVANRHDAPCAVRHDGVLHTRAAGGIVMQRAEAQFRCGLVNHVQARIHCAAAACFAVHRFEAEMVVAQAAGQGDFIADIGNGFGINADILFGLITDRRAPLLEQLVRTDFLMAVVQTVFQQNIVGNLAVQINIRAGGDNFGVGRTRVARSAGIAVA